MTRRSEPLVILSPAFPANEQESTWVFSQQLLVKTLKENFPELPVIVFAFLFPYHRGRYDWKGAKVISFNGMQNRKWRRIFLWLKIWQTLRHIQRRDGIGGIISFWCGECALIGTYFARLHGIKHYCWICGQDARKTNRFVKLIRPKADQLVAMSNFLVNEFHKSHGIKPLHIIPNGIDPGLFPQKLSEERDIDIMGTGSLEPLKQYASFVHIIKAIEYQIPCIRAILCGDGPEREKLSALISNLELENKLQIPGLTPHSQVLQLMGRSKIFLHTSSYEGFSTVCLEALYAGTQVISFCDPLQGTLPHWHVVRTEGEMIHKAIELLLSPATEYTSVLAYRIQDSAKAFVKLLNDSAVMIRNISFYNDIADSYNDVIKKDASNALIRQKVKEKFLALLPAGSVLDFGGGTGLDLEWLTTAYTVFFCEPSSAMREKAKRHEQDDYQKNKVIFLEDGKTDFTCWQKTTPFGEPVDGILCNFGVINYIPNINHLFSQLALVIKSGGPLIVVVLAFNLKKRLQWHRRNAIRSLISRSPFMMYIPHPGGRQTVFIHSLKEIINASSGHFDYHGHNRLNINNFVIIHLARK